MSKKIISKMEICRALKSVCDSRTFSFEYSVAHFGRVAIEEGRVVGDAVRAVTERYLDRPEDIGISDITMYKFAPEAERPAAWKAHVSANMSTWIDNIHSQQFA